MSLTRPDPFSHKWAQQALADQSNKNEKTVVIPPDSGADSANGKADIQTGFPAVTMRSVLKGGVPPWGSDHNGILYKITEAIQWTQGGGLPSYDVNFANANGGYSKGTILQTADQSKPWVLWMNLQDGNLFNPDLNAINKVGEQNGWIRFPVISDVEGNVLYYDDDGKLQVASPSITTTKYVSSSKGNDVDGNGSRENPLFSIDKAIADTPSSGSVVIYLKSNEPHIWSNGGIYQDENNLADQINLLSKKVIIKPYDDDDIINQATSFFGNVIVDDTWGYCVNEIKRPIIKLLWKKIKTKSENNEWVYTTAQFCSANGTLGDFSISFYGVELEVDRVNELDSLNFIMNRGWLSDGGKYSFRGCVFDKLIKQRGNYIVGVGGNSPYETSCNFAYRNFFKDGTNIENRFFWNPQNLTITAEDNSEPQNMGNYTLIGSNTVPFLSRNSTFNDNVFVIKNPSPQYKGLITNLVISGVS